MAYFASGHLLRHGRPRGAADMSDHDFDFEPIRGLPALLPAGEKLLWQDPRLEISGHPCVSRAQDRDLFRVARAVAYRHRD